MFGILVLVMAVGQTFALTEQVFKEEFAGMCIEQGLWEPKSAVSMENFIYLVEKLEKKLQMPTANFIGMLLEQFSCKRLSNENNAWEQEFVYKVIDRITQMFLADMPKSERPDITDDEKCQLFFMLSQSIQRIMDDDGSENYSIYEHGVVKVNGNEKQAVDLSKVLLGILAGLNSKSIPVKDFYLPNGITEREDKSLNNLYAFTISETIISALLNSKGLDVNKLHSGIWTSTICPKQYKRDDDSSDLIPTLAEVIGALDGFRLGKKISKMANAMDIKLSQILRMYYTKEGFRENAKDQNGISYCNRQSFEEEIDQSELQDETLNYAVAYVQSTLKAIETTVVEDEAKEFSKRIKIIISGSAIVDDEACKEEDGDECETPSNTFIILDKRNGNYTEQKTIAGNLVNELNVGLDEGSITINLNSMYNGNLETVVNSSDSKAYAACTLENYNQNQPLTAASDSDVLSEINNVLKTYETNQKYLLGVPGKVVVYFNFGTLENQPDGLNRVKRLFETQHPYVTLIPIGNDEDYLKQYFSNNQPSRMMKWNDPNLVSDLKDTICKAPFVLQYENCRVKSTFEESTYVGHITEKHVHYFVMHPKYFLKSFDYEFQFAVENGAIRVCFSRNEQVTDSAIPASRADCKSSDNSDNKKTIEFKKDNPCDGRNVYNCKPFYFSVFGRSDDSSGRCSDETKNEETIGCRRLDQIKFTIKHKGIACSSAKHLISSPFFHALMTFIVAFYVITWKK